MISNFVNKCLVARPNVQDRYFKNSVVFVFEQLESQITGVIVNKKHQVNTQQLMAANGWSLPTPPDPVYTGGPVNPNSVIMLHTNDWRSSSTFDTGGLVSVTSDEMMCSKFCSGDVPQAYKFCQGMSVWQPAQLQSEIARNHWLVVDLSVHQLFDYNGLTLWDMCVEQAAQQTYEKFI